MKWMNINKMGGEENSQHERRDQIKLIQSIKKINKKNWLMMVMMMKEKPTNKYERNEKKPVGGKFIQCNVYDSINT